tara:strand:- start:1687 stop:2196 length:510 start_codon:yes stop_codon:yes gene_type:complete
MAVYFLFAESPGEPRIKIGRTKGPIEKRRRALQTGNPDRLKLVGEIRSKNDSKLEAALHREFEAMRVDPKLEWFWLEPAAVWPVLERHQYIAFVGVQGDAFEIVDHDRDGIPEYAGIWEWGQFDHERCCPFCGWLGGMHFQDASQMYHCTECDTLTIFEEDRESDQDEL